MTILINNQRVLNNMALTAADLEGEISKLLKKAMQLIPEKGYSINLYWGKPDSYTADSVDVIRRFWTEPLSKDGDVHKEGLITLYSPPMSQEEFLQWASEQQAPVQETILRNIEAYIAAPPETVKFESFDP